MRDSRNQGPPHNPALYSRRSRAEQINGVSLRLFWRMGNWECAESPRQVSYSIPLTGAITEISIKVGSTNSGLTKFWVSPGPRESISLFHSQSQIAITFYSFQPLAQKSALSQNWERRKSFHRPITSDRRPPRSLPPASPVSLSLCRSSEVEEGTTAAAAAEHS